ncbi:MAG: hypothetical protein NT077_01685 [Candidatus Taylorbacteria bacterium]|nr:hypothetical protein [Candidatus Taylorbacteria bacterium]
MYFLVISLGLCIAYFLIYWLFSLFFTRSVVGITKNTILSIAIIFVFSVVGYYITFLIPNLEFGNRILHTFVGGFLCTLICFLVVRDGGFNITKLQFFIFSLLIVTALGVLNEHIEYFLQTYVRYLFYSNPKDTWLDLLSNTVGILIANTVFIPFVNKRKPTIANPEK